MVFGLENTRYMQCVAATAGSLAIAAGSMYSAWSSPTLILLQGNDSPLGEPLNDEEASWLVSVFLLAGIPAAPLVAFCLEKYGRKKTLLLAGLLMFFPWFLIIFATDSWMLFLARIIGGVGFIMATSAAAIYNGEIADKDIRGKLSSLFTTMKLLGNFTVLAVGPFVSYVTLGVICLCGAGIFLAIFFFMPESPYYLIRTGNIESAEKVIKKLASSKASQLEIEMKLADMKTMVETDMSNKMSFKEFYTKKEYRKVIFVMIGIKTLQQMSGQAAIDAYMQTIIAESGSNISDDISSIICGLAQFPGAILALIVIDILGRKPILFISAVGCAVALSAEGAYFYLFSHEKNVDSIAWLPTAGIMTYLFFSNFGILNLPYVLLGELFATNIKGIAVTSATFYGGILAFIVSKSFAPASEAWGEYTVFWIFAGFCTAGAIFVLCFLPETKGKSFDEIQAKFNRHLLPTQDAKTKNQIKDLDGK